MSFDRNGELNRYIELAYADENLKVLSQWKTELLSGDVSRSDWRIV